MFYEFFQANTLSPALISADSFMVVVNNGSCTENGALQRDKHFGNVRLMCPFNLEQDPLQRLAQLEALKVAMMSSCLVRAPQSFLSLSARVVTSISLPPLRNPMTSISFYSQYSPRQHNTPQPQNVSKFSFTMTKRTLFTSPPLLCAPSSGEQVIISALAKSFPNATDIAVVDISGGCGSMYEVQ